MPRHKRLSPKGQPRRWYASCDAAQLSFPVSSLPISPSAPAGSVSYPDDSSAMLLSVFDGHGADGSAVSSRAMTSMIAVLGGGGAESQRLREDPAAALTAAFQAAQTQLEAAALRKELDAKHSGACSLVAYVREQTLWIANAGDCACVLATAQANTATAAGKKAMQPGSRYVARKLSMEHKVDEPSEKARLEASGAWVRPAVFEANGGLSCPARLYRCKGEDSRRFGPGLAISRALGDIDAVSCGLIFTPDVQKHTLQAMPAAADGTPSDAEHDAFLILASDGVWEFLSAQAACDLVAPIYARGGTAAEACKALIERAQHCWKADDDEYSDDITAIVVFVPALLAALGTGIPLF